MAVKAKELWRKRFGHGIPLFDISKNDGNIVILLNDYNETEDNIFNRLVLLDEKGATIGSYDLNPEFYVSDLKFAGDYIVCFGAKDEGAFFQMFNRSLNLAAGGLLDILGDSTRIFVKGHDWYAYKKTGNYKKLRCYKNGLLAWEQEVSGESYAPLITISGESELIHVWMGQKSESLSKISVMGFGGEKKCDVLVPAIGAYSSFSSKKITVIGGDSYTPQPNPLTVYDNSGNLLFQKQLRIETRSVFVSKTDTVFVGLHSEYDNHVGGIIIFDRGGNEVADIDTKNWAGGFVSVKGGDVVAAQSGDKLLLFDKNGLHLDTVCDVQSFSPCAAGANHILTKNMHLGKDKKDNFDELVLLKVVE